MTAVTGTRTVHFVLPEGVHDPGRPSGGNRYDDRVCRDLAGAGWTVRQRVVPGPWPERTQAAREQLGRTLAALPDGTLVVVDGLVGSAQPEVLVPEARRLRIVVLLHLPLGDDPPYAVVADRERAVLAAAAAVVTTSAWTAAWVVERYGLDPGVVVAAPPGVDPAPPVPGTPAGGELLCVAAVTYGKGHDLLVDALGALAELPWRCTCVGSLARDPAWVSHVEDRARRNGIADRVTMTGVRRGAALDAWFSASDALVLASRRESYGMVVTEALARGLPVVATAAGGVREALGRAPDGRVPGLLVPPGDAGVLAVGLRRWLTEPDLRTSLRAAAVARRDTLPDWPSTTAALARTLAEVAG